MSHNRHLGFVSAVSGNLIAAHSRKPSLIMGTHCARSLSGVQMIT